MKDSLAVFKSYLISIYPEMGEEESGYLLKNCSRLSVASRNLIIEENKIQKNIFFLTSGLVRGFYNDANGDEITIRFLCNKGWVTHFSALISNTPSRYIFQATEQSELISLPYATILDGYQKFKGLERFGRLIAENVLKMQQMRIESFQFQTAEQRYLSFIENSPELYNRVSISHLSTYLGIKRQSLTRIRKKLATQSF